MQTSRLLLPVNVALLLLATSVVHAEEMGRDKVEPLYVHTPASSPKQKTADILANFVNVETNDKLIGADSTVGTRVELIDGDGKHRPFTDFKFEEDVEAAFRSLELHLRVAGLKRPLKHGESFLVDMQFESGAHLPLTVVVE